MTDHTYDIETYPNIFTFSSKNSETGERHRFEISWRVNQVAELMQFLMQLRANGDRMVGFNNQAFDYPVLHFIIENHQSITVADIYHKANQIINTHWNNRFAHVIWDDQQHIPQIDLLKVHHFDNTARLTSLKVLEFNMRSQNIEDLPFPPGTLLNWTECDELIVYNDHDVDETEKFYFESVNKIKFREELSVKYDRNFLNHNDGKIGKDYTIMEMERMMPGSCYDYSSGSRKPRQTARDQVVVRDIIFPYVQFDHPEFQRILNWFEAQVITDTKKAFGEVNCSIRGFQFDFGTGGIHGSVSSQIVESDEEYMIEDWDVASYYPNLGIRNKLFPHHLSENFCNIYEDVFNQRKGYKKGTAENLMLKLALNSVYGDSNSKYSPFYDPQYTMSITINGQLLLCMLAEKLMSHAQVEMIQINTDGMTIRYHRSLKEWVHSLADWWMQVTNLELEHVEYNRMFIRDVNNYIGEYPDGKLKRKGAYCHERAAENPSTQEIEWHKKHSALVIPKAAEAALVRGEDIRTFVENHSDIHDFMMLAKVNRTDKLFIEDYHGVETEIQKTSRFYVSVMGYDLIKVMKPLPKNPGVWRRGAFPGIKTWKVTICNDMSHCNPDDIEFEYYIKEAEKLVNPLRSAS
jgi:hypothetical protein